MAGASSLGRARARSSAAIMSMSGLPAAVQIAMAYAIVLAQEVVEDLRALRANVRTVRRALDPFTTRADKKQPKSDQKGYAAFADRHTGYESVKPGYSASFEFKWVTMGDSALPRRRTHGRAGAGALALVTPLPPTAVAGRPGFTRAKRPWLQSPPADRWAAIQGLALARSLLPGAHHPFEIQ
jgi:hypothetical protein